MTTIFNEIAAQLDRLEVPIGASEAHGLLCGLLCTQPSGVAKSRWMGELLDAAAINPDTLSSRAEDVRGLDTWFTSELERLNDSELGFDPVLPADSRPLAERLQSLADFCAGFTYGVGIGTAGRGNQPFPADTREIIEDFVAIDSTASDDLSAADENMLVELTEYVRVGVLLIHEELQPVNDNGKKQLH